MTGRLRIIVILLAALLAAAGYAQTGTSTAPAVTGLQPDSMQVRLELKQILDRYPPEVGSVLKLDPTLFGSESYLATYPDLARFIAQHPEIAHNPRFYLDQIRIAGDFEKRSASERIWRDMLEGMMILISMLTVAGVLIWFIKTVIAHRKWSRLSRVQSEVHAKLLDRFTSSEDLLAYVQSPAGKRFLESAPIPVDEGAPVSAPLGRILWSVQVGLVIGMAGVGLFIVSSNIEREMAQPIFAMGTLATAVGAGFVLSAIVSYAISRRLGVWGGTPQTRAAE
jgi:hypothetical protein